MECGEAMTTTLLQVDEIIRFKYKKSVDLKAIDESCTISNLPHDVKWFYKSYELITLGRLAVVMGVHRYTWRFGLGWLTILKIRYRRLGSDVELQFVKMKKWCDAESQFSKLSANSKYSQLLTKKLAAFSYLLVFFSKVPYFSLGKAHFLTFYVKKFLGGKVGYLRGKVGLRRDGYPFISTITPLCVSNYTQMCLLVLVDLTHLLLDKCLHNVPADCSLAEDWDLGLESGTHWHSVVPFWAAFESTVTSASVKLENFLFLLALFFACFLSILGAISTSSKSDFQLSVSQFKRPIWVSLDSRLALTWNFRITPVLKMKSRKLNFKSNLENRTKTLWN